MSKNAPTWLTALLSTTGDPLVRGRALLIVMTCLSVCGAYAALIVVWFVSGDLDWESLVAWGVLAGILAGLVALVRNGLLQRLCPGDVVVVAAALRAKGNGDDYHQHNRKGNARPCIGVVMPLDAGCEQHSEYD